MSSIEKQKRIKLFDLLDSMNIQRKLQFSFFTIIILVVILGGETILQLNASFNMMSELYNHHLQGIRIVKEAQVNLITRGRAENGISTVTSFDDILSFQSEMKSNSSLFLGNMLKFEKEVASTPEEINASKEITSIWTTKLVPISSQLEQARALKDSAKIADTIKQESEIVKQVEDKINKIVAQKDKAAQELQNKMKGQRTLALVMSSIIFVLCIGISYLLQRYLYRTIGIPVKNMGKVAQQIAQGDLGSEIEAIDRQDEIGSLSRSFVFMKNSLKGVILDVKDAASEAKRHSQELMSTSQEASAITYQVSEAMDQLAEGANQQAQDVEDINHKVTGISEKIQEVAIDIEDATYTSKNVNATAKSGAEQAKEAVEKIEKVKETSQRVEEVMGALTIEMQKISQMGALIDGIAAKTNILSINAAIEASRAGDAGRGFSVVAEEVRRLAEQSSQSAKDIMGVIYDLQDELTAAANIIHQGHKAVEEGVIAVHRSGESFKIIEEHVQDITNKIDKINYTTQDITKSSGEMVSAIENISAIAEETAATGEEVFASSQQQASATEEVARSAEELARISNTLNSAIEMFRV